MKKVGKKNVGLILVISFLVLIGLATTYAWLVWNSSNNTELTLTIGDVAEVTYEEGNEINVTGIGPVLDSSDGESTVFGINKNTVESLSTSISLDITGIDDGLKNKTFKWILYSSDVGSAVSLNGNDVTYYVLQSGDFLDAAVGFYNLADDVTLSDGVTKYKLVIYIDGNEENDVNMMGKTFTAKLNVTISPPPDFKIRSMTVGNTKLNSFPATGAYSINSYSCDTDASLGYSSLTRSITVSNFKKTWCSVDFATSTLLLKDVPTGSFVSYTGNNGCTGDSCSGTNVNATSDSNRNTFGWCGSSDYKYFLTGWILGYTDDSGNPYLISASAPECLAKDSTETVDTFTDAANTEAIKYCNTSYSLSGTCVLNDSTNTDAWAITNTDFWNTSYQYTSGVAPRNLSSNYNNDGEYHCLGVRSSNPCGYGQIIFDNGGYYAFNAYEAATTDTNLLIWDPSKRAIASDNSLTSYGLRVTLRLKSTIKVTGGTGTMDDPYTISP